MTPLTAKATGTWWTTGAHKTQRSDEHTCAYISVVQALMDTFVDCSKIIHFLSIIISYSNFNLFVITRGVPVGLFPLVLVPVFIVHIYRPVSAFWHRSTKGRILGRLWCWFISPTCLATCISQVLYKYTKMPLVLPPAAADQPRPFAENQEVLP